MIGAPMPRWAQRERAPTLMIPAHSMTAHSADTSATTTIAHRSRAPIASQYPRRTSTRSPSRAPSGIDSSQTCSASAMVMTAEDTSSQHEPWVTLAQKTTRPRTGSEKVR